MLSFHLRQPNQGRQVIEEHDLWWVPGKGLVDLRLLRMSHAGYAQLDLLTRLVRDFNAIELPDYVESLVNIMRDYADKQCADITCMRCDINDRSDLDSRSYRDYPEELRDNPFDYLKSLVGWGIEFDVSMGSEDAPCARGFAVKNWRWIRVSLNEELGFLHAGYRSVRLSQDLHDVAMAVETQFRYRNRRWTIEVTQSDCTHSLCDLPSSDICDAVRRWPKLQAGSY